MRYRRILMDIDDTIFDFQPGNRNAGHCSSLTPTTIPHDSAAYPLGTIPTAQRNAHRRTRARRTRPHRPNCYRKCSVYLVATPMCASRCHILVRST